MRSTLVPPPACPIDAVVDTRRSYAGLRFRNSEAERRIVALPTSGFGGARTSWSSAGFRLDSGVVA